MNNFNFSRFGKVLHRLCLVRRKKMLSMTIGLTIFFALAGIMSIEPFHVGPVDKAGIALRFLGMFSMITIVFSVYSVIGGYLIISDLKDKKVMIDELTLPATMLEKFVARLLFASLGVLLSLAAAFLVADVIQQLLCMILHDGERLSMLGFLADNQQIVIRSMGSAAMVVIFTIFQNSIFILGGVFFKKVPWLCTLITLFGLFVIASMLILGAIKLFSDHPEFRFTIPDFDIPQAVWFFILAGLTALNYFLSYRLFCRLQVVNNRWFNI